MTAIHLHPERTPDPAELRWVADTTALPEATPAMRELLDDHILSALEISPGEIRTTLAPGQNWAAAGGRVRSVLFQALSTGGPTARTWRIQVEEVLRREVAPLVDSHGGQINIESLTADTLIVSLGGTCGHCTLRTTTLRNLVATAVQAHFPQIRQVRAVNP